MAAMDLFDDYLRGLPADLHERHKPLIAQCRSELLAARSEEARVRLVHEFIKTMLATQEPVQARR